MKLLKLFFKEVTVHYKNSGFQYDLEKLLEHHKSLVKGNKSKGISLDKSMPLWPKNTEKTTKKKI